MPLIFVGVCFAVMWLVTQPQKRLLSSRDPVVRGGARGGLAAAKHLGVLGVVLIVVGLAKVVIS